jgi:hypothetical protein
MENGKSKSNSDSDKFLLQGVVEFEVLDPLIHLMRQKGYTSNVRIAPSRERNQEPDRNKILVRFEKTGGKKS